MPQRMRRPTWGMVETEVSLVIVIITIGQDQNMQYLVSFLLQHKINQNLTGSYKITAETAAFDDNDCVVSSFVGFEWLAPTKYLHGTYISQEKYTCLALRTGLLLSHFIQKQRCTVAYCHILFFLFKKKKQLIHLDSSGCQQALLFVYPGTVRLQKHWGKENTIPSCKDIQSLTGKNQQQ